MSNDRFMSGWYTWIVMKLLVVVNDEKEIRYLEPVLSIFYKKNIHTKIVTFSWKYRTQKDWIEEVYRQNGPLDDYFLFGFSLSALVALLVSSQYKVKGLVLISVTPLFFETTFPQKVIKYLGKRRLMEAKRIKISRLKILSNEVYLLVGKNEDSELQKQNALLSKTDKKINFQLIKNTSHSAITPEMLEAVETLITKIKKQEL